MTIVKKKTNFELIIYIMNRRSICRGEKEERIKGELRALSAMQGQEQNIRHYKRTYYYKF